MTQHLVAQDMCRHGVVPMYGRDSCPACAAELIAPDVAGDDLALDAEKARRIRAEKRVVELERADLAREDLPLETPAKGKGKERPSIAAIIGGAKW